MNDDLFICCIEAELREYGKEGSEFFNQKLRRVLTGAPLTYGYSAFLEIEERLEIANIKLSEEEAIWLAILIGRVDSYRDPLTKTLRRDIIKVIDEALIPYWFRDESFSGLGVAYMDLDKFGDINKLYGQHNGDLALKAAADNITTGLRDSDALIRMGGDEFLILMPNFLSEGPRKEHPVNQEVLEAFSKKLDGAALKLSLGEEDITIEIKGSTGFSYLNKAQIADILESDGKSVFDKLAVDAGENLLKNKPRDRKLHIRRERR